MDQFSENARSIVSSLTRSNRSRSDLIVRGIFGFGRHHHEHHPTATSTSTIKSHHTAGTSLPAPTEELFLRIRSRDWSAVGQRLMEYPWDAQCRLDSGNRATPLHLALMHRAPIGIISMLIDAYPKALVLQDSEGWSPMHVNILYGSEEDISLLLIRRGGPLAASLHSRFVGSPLHLACRHGSSFRILKELVCTNPEQVTVPNEAGTTVPNVLWKSFLRRCQIQDERYAQQLADQLLLLMTASNGMRLNLPCEREEPCLHQAIQFQFQYGHETDLVALLLRLYPDSALRTDPDDRRLPIHTAASFPSQQTILQTILPHSCPQDPVQLLLLKQPRTCRQRDANGRLPLHIALATGRRQWSTGGGIKELVTTFPQSLLVKDPMTQLYPFLLAAMEQETTTTAAKSTRRSGTASRALEGGSVEDSFKLETIYQLMRQCPELVCRERSTGNHADGASPSSCGSMDMDL
jgi:hypothetical protein